MFSRLSPTDGVHQFHEVRYLVFLGGVAMMTTLAGCKELTGNPGLPAGTPDPSFYNTAVGALGMRNATLWQVEQAIPQYVIDAGQLTDELESTAINASAGIRLLNGGGVPDPLDERILPEDGTVTVASYGQLQAVRTLGNQAIGALATYDTTAAQRDSGTVLRGELYAMEGYAEILLADLFCSGVPLSDLVYKGDFQYEPSSTTTQVYRDAIAKFDTALMLAGNHDSLANFARVGQGRAILDLGDYQAAADDVTGVPPTFQYDLNVQWNVQQGTPSIYGNLINNSATVSNHEGTNGLWYRSSDDPRTATIVTCIPQPTQSSCTDTLTFPVKYGAGLAGSGFAPFTLASGIEARLMQAEAQLQAVLPWAGGSSSGAAWLGTLNDLRANAAVYTNGAIPPLSPLTDPGIGLNATAAATARIKLLFQERAFWLFLDGHRQGDLRRLIRQYGNQDPDLAFASDQHVYPSGPYLAPGAGRYGSDVTAPIPITEDANPYFHGCINRNP